LWDTLRVDETHVKCVDISELPGVLTGFSTDLQNSRITCVELMSVENTGCVSYLARQPGQDRLCLMACDEFGLCDTTILNIVILEKEYKRRELIVHNGFSPNGDGQNDIFTIKNVEFYPDNQLTIFNRWGNEILKVKGYKNDWKGAWKGKDLPDGTYYYLLDDGFGNILSGFIQIER